MATELWLGWLALRQGPLAPERLGLGRPKMSMGSGPECWHLAAEPRCCVTVSEPGWFASELGPEWFGLAPVSGSAKRSG